MLKPPNGGGDSSDGVLGPPLTDGAREKLLPGPGSSQLLRLVLLHHIVHSLVDPEVSFLLVGLLSEGSEAKSWLAPETTGGWKRLAWSLGSSEGTVVLRDPGWNFKKNSMSQAKAFCNLL